jgi:hypothetical protein
LFTRNSQTLKNSAAGLFIFLTTVLYIKIKLIDSRIFGTLQTEMGKTKLLLSVRTVGEMLETMSPEEVIMRIKLVSQKEIQMKKYAIKINEIFRIGEVEEKPLITLSKKEEKIVIEQIQNMLDIIQKRREAIKAGKLPSFEEMIQKDLNHQKNIDEHYREPQRKKALSRFLKFSKS